MPFFLELEIRWLLLSTKHDRNQIRQVLAISRKMRRDAKRMRMAARAVREQALTKALRAEPIVAIQLSK